MSRGEVQPVQQSVKEGHVRITSWTEIFYCCRRLGEPALFLGRCLKETGDDGVARLPNPLHLKNDHLRQWLVACNSARFQMNRRLLCFLLVAGGPLGAAVV